MTAEHYRLRARQSEAERRIRLAVRALPGAAELVTTNDYRGIQVVRKWGSGVDEVVDYINACQPGAIRELLRELNRLRRMVP